MNPEPDKSSSDTQSPTLSRRRMLGGTLATAGILFVPGRVLGLDGAASPNNKLNIAGIGIGGKGKDDLAAVAGENIVALCDVDWNIAAPVFDRYPKARRFRDYRKMLDEMPEIDAVVIATPDHHHAPTSMEAIKRHKHVYCEKPLTHSVWESRRVAEAAREAKIATQMGNAGQASPATRRLCELIWGGAIGKVHEVHVWTDRPSQGLFGEYWPQGVNRPGETPAVPETIDWDLWLGPAPQRPYHPAYHPFRWRGWWDFGTGALGDIGCHYCDPVFRALKLGAPLSVQGASTRVNGETFPLGSMVTYEFPARDASVQANNPHVRGMSGPAAGGIGMPPCKLVWYDGGLRPPRPADLPDHIEMGDNGLLVMGENGYILGDRVFPESRAREAAGIPSSIPPSPGHYEEWINACKGGPPAGSNFDWAGPLTESVLLGNIALRHELRQDLTRFKLLWDSPALRFTNLDKANPFLRRTYRQGWGV
ncbi:MAG: Gfo/Idh/MocA family oxidoreductase [Verrucomicrobia bacterium]|nr:Gfo/Idh/MocA family oxidoreductase [Verrucomicrobiota bacterium]